MSHIDNTNPLTPDQRAQYHRVRTLSVIDQIAPIGTSGSEETGVAMAQLHALLYVGACLEGVRDALDSVVYHGAAITTTRGG